MAKGTSFAEKAKRGIKREEEFTVVKYVKSIVSEKSGHYRFQESMLKVPSDKSLDAYLKELEAGPVEEVEEVADAQEESTADIQEPGANEMQTEGGGEPSGELREEEVETQEDDAERTHHAGDGPVLDHRGAFGVVVAELGAERHVWHVVERHRCPHEHGKAQEPEEEAGLPQAGRREEEQEPGDRQRHRRGVHEGMPASEARLPVVRKMTRDGVRERVEDEGRRHRQTRQRTG